MYLVTVVVCRTVVVRTVVSAPLPTVYMRVLLATLVATVVLTVVCTDTIVVV